MQQWRALPFWTSMRASEGGTDVEERDSSENPARGVSRRAGRRASGLELAASCHRAARRTAAMTRAWVDVHQVCNVRAQTRMVEPMTSGLPSRVR
jgi:hypothetical protein